MSFLSVWPERRSRTCIQSFEKTLDRSQSNLSSSETSREAVLDWLCRGARDLQLELFHFWGIIEAPTDAAWGKGLGRTERQAKMNQPLVKKHGKAIVEASHSFNIAYSRDEAIIAATLWWIEHGLGPIVKLHFPVILDKAAEKWKEEIAKIKEKYKAHEKLAKERKKKGLTAKRKQDREVARHARAQTLIAHVMVPRFGQPILVSPVNAGWKEELARRERLKQQAKNARFAEAYGRPRSVVEAVESNAGFPANYPVPNPNARELLRPLATPLYDNESIPGNAAPRELLFFQRPAERLEISTVAK